ncbi:MAG: glutathione S-transferase N-terminal domain-containing protein [Pseudomonadota bacterium]
MLQLYYAPDNASLVLRLALEEASAPYGTILVDRATGAQTSAAYQKVNPVGKIPTLLTPDGAVSETGACLLWISDTYPEAGLGPAIQDAKRGPFLRWLFYLSNTVHADLIRVFYAERFVPPEALERHHEMMVGHLRTHLGILEGAIRDDPALFEPPSALSLYLGPLVRWAALYPRSRACWLTLDDYPVLSELMMSLEARASVGAAVLAEGLGDRPFSRPQVPQPPEGSAI